MDLRKTRNILLLISLVSLTGNLGGQDVKVDKEELASIGAQSVDFVSYRGPHEVVDTLDQIREIGEWLGSRIDAATNSEASIGNKYRIIHIVSPKISEGLDADILILGENAAVDHIVNLRTILAGYIETRYGLESRNAYLIAEFITYYNAVHRGNVAVVEKRYKLPVRKALEPAKIGLDTHYSNWPGRTQILIPLRGNLQSPKVDTGAVSGKEVIEEMRKTEDMGLGKRQDMVDLREQEFDKEQAELDRRSEELGRQEEEIETELESLPTDAMVRKEQLEEEKREVEKEKAAIEDNRKELEERVEEVLEMRDDIAEDRNVLLAAAIKSDKEEPPVPVNPVWFLTVDDDGEGLPFGRVIKYNMTNNRPLAESSVTAVRGRTMVFLQNELLVIAGKTGGNSRVRPILLDRDTLKIKKEGSHDVFPGSLITTRGNDIFLITTENGEWRLGKFSKTLERVAVSDKAVEPWTSLSFEEDALFIQGVDGDVLRLSSDDLVEYD